MPQKKLFRPRTYVIYAPSDLSKRWNVEYYLGGVRKRSEKGINQHKTAARRRIAAEELITELKAKYRHYRIKSQTEDALLHYLEEQRGRWSKDTYQEYAGIIRKFCEFLDGREVNEELVRVYMAKLNRSLHGTTWNKYRQVIRKGLTTIGCMDWFDLIPTEKSIKTPLRYYETHQALQLGDAMEKEDPTLWLYVQFIFYTFIRPKELRGLRVGDILFDAAEIRVPGEISKNNRAAYVAIPDVFQQQLEHLKKRPPGDLVFPGKNGKRLGKNTMYRRHLKFLTRFKFGTGYSLYSWKHTGAVALAKVGVSIKEIQLQMRHHSLDQTDQYLRQLGIRDVVKLRYLFPNILNYLITNNAKNGLGE